MSDDTGTPAAKKARAPRARKAAKPSSPRGTAPASREPAARDAPAAKATPGIEATAATPRPLIRVPLAVRWRDLDAFNHVNNSKYLSFLEEARLQWMLTLPGMGMDDRVAPVVAAAQLNYRRPIEWPAQVDIDLFVERIGTSSLTIGHRILDARDASTLYCDGHVVLVWIDRGSGQAAPLPVEVRGAIEGG